MSITSFFKRTTSSKVPQENLDDSFSDFDLSSSKVPLEKKESKKSHPLQSANQNSVSAKPCADEISFDNYIAASATDEGHAAENRKSPKAEKRTLYLKQYDDTRPPAEEIVIEDDCDKIANVSPSTIKHADISTFFQRKTPAKHSPLSSAADHDATVSLEKDVAVLANDVNGETDLDPTVVENNISVTHKESGTTPQEESALAPSTEIDFSSFVADDSADSAAEVQVCSEAEPAVSTATEGTTDSDSEEEEDTSDVTSDSSSESSLKSSSGSELSDTEDPDDDDVTNDQDDSSGGGVSDGAEVAVSGRGDREEARRLLSLLRPETEKQRKARLRAQNAAKMSALDAVSAHTGSGKSNVQVTLLGATAAADRRKKDKKKAGRKASKKMKYKMEIEKKAVVNRKKKTEKTRKCVATENGDSDVQEVPADAAGDSMDDAKTLVVENNDVTEETQAPEQGMPTRRSSRRCAQAALANIRQSLDTSWSSIINRCGAEESPQKKPRRKKAAVEDSDDGTSSPRRKPRRKAKVPAMFRRQDSEESSDSDVEVVAMDPEVKARRDAFLFSGVPEAMRSKTDTDSAVTLAEHAPLPAVSHVTQTVGSEALENTALRLQDLCQRREELMSRKQAEDAGETRKSSLPEKRADVSDPKECDTERPEKDGDLDEAAVYSDEDAVRSDVEKEDCVTSEASQCTDNLLDAVERELNLLKIEEEKLKRHASFSTALGLVTDMKITEPEAFLPSVSVPSERLLVPPVEATTQSQRRLACSFGGHTAIESDHHRLLLHEISRENPSYPTHKKFTLLQESSDDLRKDSSAEDGKSKKRKLDGAAEGQRSKRQKQGGEAGARVTARRRSARRTSLEDCVIISDTAVEDQGTSLTEHEPALSWTQRYQPRRREELVGSSRALKRLGGWLEEWRRETDLELRRLKKLFLKQARRRGKGREEARRAMERELGAQVHGLWSDDDSDFDLSGESDAESDVEESRLCNTMLITGPPGAGKTTAVYAVAQELGYKVFEVNASNRRSGKEVLAQLQEATQSLQVSRNNLDSMFTTFMQMEKEGKSAAEFAEVQKAKKKEMATNFFNLRKREFNKFSDGKAAKEAPSPTKDSVNKKGLDLTSVSMLLFEEVDVVFEEDRGFLAAIQAFMTGTKRPIVLTANDTSVLHVLGGRLEHVTLPRPPEEHLATHLQLLCLSEQLRTCAADMRAVARLCAGDVRRAVLTAQFWAESGGSAAPRACAVSRAPEERGKTVAGKHQTDATDSGEDFQVVQRARSRRRRAIVDDDDDRRCDVALSADAAPPSHRECAAVVAGVCLHGQQTDGLLGVLSTGGLAERTAVQCRFLEQGVDLIHCNLPRLTGLPVEVGPLSLFCPSDGVTVCFERRRRIRNADDLFDSDIDDSGTETAEPVEIGRAHV